jgi:hypothetical protein
VVYSKSASKLICCAVFYGLVLPVKDCENFTLLLIILLQAGDIEPNLGRRDKQATAFPCGLCEIPVTWICEGVCCDSCNIWYDFGSCRLLLITRINDIKSSPQGIFLLGFGITLLQTKFGPV